MDGSGELSREKEEAVRNLCHAHDEYQTATENLNTLTPLIHGRNEQRVRKVSAALGMQEVPSLDDLRRNTREKLDVLTENTRKLTGKIQDHFPEVIVYVGYGLPPELGGLWRPAHSLESFDERHQVPTVSNHKILRVRSGDEWFALKEYTIGAPGKLQTCLKEATVVYQQRHPAIVEMKALFQDFDGTSFYIQMPWYEHGRWTSGSAATNGLDGRRCAVCSRTRWWALRTCTTMGSSTATSSPPIFWWMAESVGDWAISTFRSTP